MSLLPREPLMAGALVRPRLADFYELAKPRLNFLVLITTLIGFFLASRNGLPSWGLLLHTLLGTALTAAGASVLNQFLEREPDGRMGRTMNRPLPAGRVSPWQALTFGLFLGLLGTLWLTLLVNALTAALGALTLTLYVLVYTPLKLRSSLCTLVGAVPGAIPPVMGFTAATGRIDAPALSLFAILFLWQMPHFLAIALLYRDDYARAGFKMLPVVDPQLHFTGRQIVLYSLALIPTSLLPFGLGMAGWIYAAAATILGAAFLAAGIEAARSKGRPEARRLFIASIIYLPLLLGAMLAG